MAIIDNRTTAEGDVLIIKPEIPIVGLISLYNFVDTTDNESETEYFLKEFRYSVDGGINFSSWNELTIENISSIKISKENQFVIEYRYTQVGENPLLDLEFDDILVSGEYEDLDYKTYNSTYLKDFFTPNDINVYGWALNVLEKVYDKGILPEYIERGNIQGNIMIDNDFLVYWNTITHYFAVIVYFARQFKDITKNEQLLEQFFINRDINVSDLDYSEMLILFENWVEEFRKRGTEQEIEEGSELKRIIGVGEFDEFILSNILNYATGICVGKSSPTWRGTDFIVNLNKSYEKDKEVKDLTKYPLVNSSGISVVEGKMIIASQSAGGRCGIYDDLDEDKRIVISSDLDYEVSFFVEVSSTNTPITFSLKGFDVDGNVVNLVSDKDGVNRNYFFEKKSLPHIDTIYYVRGVLWNKNKENDISSYIYPEGVNLKSVSSVVKIIPQIYVDNLSGSLSTGIAKFSNIKLRPLKLPISRGQIGIHDIVMMYADLSKSRMLEDEIFYKLQSEFINAGSILKINNIKEDE